jgi:hypothetical protein
MCLVNHNSFHIWNTVKLRIHQYLLKGVVFDKNAPLQLWRQIYHVSTPGKWDNISEEPPILVYQIWIRIEDLEIAIQYRVTLNIVVIRGSRIRKLPNSSYSHWLSWLGSITLPKLELVSCFRRVLNHYGGHVSKRNWAFKKFVVDLRVFRIARMLVETATWAVTLGVVGASVHDLCEYLDP